MCFTAHPVLKTEFEIEIISGGAGEERTLHRFSLCHKCDTINLSSLISRSEAGVQGNHSPAGVWSKAPKRYKRGNDMRYDVLLCDADNTLFDFNKAEENAFAIACETMGFSSTP